MNATRSYFLRAVVPFLYFLMAPVIVMATEVGGGYSRQLVENTGLEQYELFVREPLPYKTIVGDTLPVFSALEIAAGLIRDANDDHFGIGKFSVMPQVVLEPNDRIHYFFGLGAGLMAGDTKFSRHDLGGPFFLASKLGMRFFLGEGWGLEASYYHQSNAGIYDHNASLNMLQMAFVYDF